MVTGRKLWQIVPEPSGTGGADNVDARARRSAELLYNGLMECLGHAKMTDITVTAVAHSSGCGRSTLYRLFDNPSDIAQWKCGQIMLLFVSS